MSARDLRERLHPTCIEVTPRPGVPREWLCGPQCPPSVPVPIAPDAARDARVAARRAADARKASVALDQLLERMGLSMEPWQRGVADRALFDYVASKEHHNGHYGAPCATCGAMTDDHDAAAHDALANCVGMPYCRPGHHCGAMFHHWQAVSGGGE